MRLKVSTSSKEPQENPKCWRSASPAKAISKLGRLAKNDVEAGEASLVIESFSNLEGTVKKRQHVSTQPFRERKIVKITFEVQKSILTKVS